LYELLAFGSKLEKLLRFLVQPPAFVPVESRAANDPEDDPRPKIVAVVEMLDRLHDLFAVSPGY